ncbi:MAG: class I fructose-bisphosphate aldolase [Proteobacteria bacterium]|nr:class I fructose-bisphosphate aldolase [Pseudomonadota bacterium]
MNSISYSFKYTKQVEDIISCYTAENPGVVSNLRKILYSGRLGGTGKVIILPVDQGFEHGPDRSFAINKNAYDPEYHIKLAVDAGLSAYAAPLGMIECVARDYAGKIPMILKMNNGNSLSFDKKEPSQAMTSSVYDALRLGCSAIGITIYPGSLNADDMFESAKDIIQEAKSLGLATIIWSYPRSSCMSKATDIALDVIAYATHIAALLGANIIKVKLPSNSLALDTSKDVYANHINISSLDEMIAHIMQSAFCSKRIVLFSGGPNKAKDALLNEIIAIKKGGGNGSIIGRNIFQRKLEDAMLILDQIIDLYLK